MKNKKKISIYLKYGNLSASTRERFLRYEKKLSSDYNIKYNILIDNSLFKKRIQKGEKNFILLLIAIIKRIFSIILEKNKFIIIQHELIPFFPPFLEYILKIKKISYVIDIDDYIFFREKSLNFFIRKYFLFKYKYMFKYCKLVIAGNDFLKERTKQLGAKNSFTIPTLVDLNKFKKIKKNFPFKVVWVGSQSTSKYLDDLIYTFDKIKKLKEKILFYIIGPYKLNFKYSFVIKKKWSLKTYNNLILSSHAGIMPLANSDWERGKCGYKVLQYFSQKLPVLVSPVGVNKKIVTPNRNGFFCKKKSDWLKYLLKLKRNTKLATKLGNNGYSHLKKNFSHNYWSNKLLQELKKVA